MARGGKREGAGRPTGAVNKVTAEKRAEVEASGLTPLDFMLRVLRDESAEDNKRLDAAKAAAPYCHARLTAVELSGAVAGMTHEEWLASLS